MTNPFSRAASAKGSLAALKRIFMITRRYGLSPRKLEQSLRQFGRILQQHNCSATFPATAAAVKRHPQIFQSLQAQGIEFAVHGYTHIDYARLAPEQVTLHLQRAQEIFANAGINASGFRSPYLRRSTSLHRAIAAAGFAYVSNQPLMWNALTPQSLAPAALAGYQKAVDYYRPWTPANRLSLPRLTRLLSELPPLVEIPVSLPDDEILIDRLQANSDFTAATWLNILQQSHRRGELFTLQLHPERAAQCAQALNRVLEQAKTLAPVVWIARLDELAAWQREKATAACKISTLNPQTVRVEITGPAQLTVLTRFTQIEAASTRLWQEPYRQVEATSFTLTSALRPFIGVSPRVSAETVDFLRQQGYIIEHSANSSRYGIFLDRNYSPDEEYALVQQIETANTPLLRFGRWPRGAKSALAITGDIDALTLWDYALRMTGK